LSVPEAIEDLAAMKRLWVHEVLRVFGDRIWDQVDREWLLDILRNTCKNHLKNDMDLMFKHLNPDGTQV
jgi:dynein heavy chain